MVHNFVLTLAVLCNVAALGLSQQQSQYAWSKEEDDVTTCRAVKLYKRAIPHSGVDVDSVKALLLTTDLKSCVQACCGRGPTVCQYAWLFEGKCLAVSCHSNPAACYPKSASAYTSMYVKIGYVDEGDQVKPTTAHPKTESTDKIERVEPTTAHRKTESTDEVERVEPTNGDHHETESTDEVERVEPTNRDHHETASTDEVERVEPTNGDHHKTASTDGLERVEPTDGDHHETETPTKPPQLPSTSKWHHQRPALTKPVPTVSVTTTPGSGVMDTIALAELEDALNSTWKKATPLAFENPPPPSPHTPESSDDSESIVNITAVDSSELHKETNIGLTYVFVLLSCFFGFLLLFFLFLACGYYIALRGRNQKSKKVSYTVVDRDDQVDKFTGGKGSQQPLSSLVLSDSDTDEGGAMFSMVGMAAPRDDPRGKKHSSLASSLLPI